MQGRARAQVCRLDQEREAPALDQRYVELAWAPGGRRDLLDDIERDPFQEGPGLGTGLPDRCSNLPLGRPPIVTTIVLLFTEFHAEIAGSRPPFRALRLCSRRPRAALSALKRAD
jgi:hypothetical protein